MVPVDKKQYGTFYHKDCYIVLYRYQVKGEEKGIVYVWEGIGASPEERASALSCAGKVDQKEMKGRAIQVGKVTLCFVWRIAHTLLTKNTD